MKPYVALYPSTSQGTTWSTTAMVPHRKALTTTVLQWVSTAATSATTTPSAWANSSVGTVHIGTGSIPSIYISNTVVGDFSGPPPDRPLKIPEGWEGEIRLPDGTKIHVEANGSFRIDDADAHVVYRASRIREFNRYINASDLLEKFVDHLGTLGVRQSEVLEIPLEVFINWLIVEAARQDGDPVPDGIRVDDHPSLPDQHPRCRHCQKFIPRRLASHGLEFCSAEHYGAFVAALEVTTDAVPAVSQAADQ